MNLKPTQNKVPKHIALILDGNRRLAKRLMLKPWKGHEWGAKKVEKLLGWSKEIGIKELTLYCFSIENFDRPKRELEYLMKLFKEEFKRLYNDERLEKDKVKINFIGRIDMFPEEVSESMKKLMDKTKNNNNFTINFAMAYGGRTEVIDAVKKIAEQVSSGKLNINKINEETFAKYLYMPDEPELIIRTGGEKRTSNFLIWQGNYSEWIFLEKLWPEFEKEDLIECIAEYNLRERRFGR